MSRVTLVVAWLVWFVFTLSAGPGYADDWQEQLRALAAAHAGKVAIGVRHLDSNEEFLLDPDRVMPTASLIKLSVMAAAYRLADAGQLDLESMLTLREEDKVPGSGILTSHFSARTMLSVRDAIRLMIAFSDNTATNLVLDQIGLPTTAATMEELELPNTKIHAKVFRGDTSIFPDRSREFGLGSTTPREMLRLLELLHRRQLASPASCDAMLAHLQACDDKNKLPRALPPGTRLAHKTGAVNAVRTDAGILATSSGPVAICVLTAENRDKRWTEDNAAELLIGQIGRVVWDHFSPAGLPTDSAPPRQLTEGASGELVEALQRTLNARLDPSPALNADGDFGPVTRAAVERFQQARQLPVSGQVDSATWQALGPLVFEDAAVPAPDEVNSAVLPRTRERGKSEPPEVTCQAWAIADATSGDVKWSHRADDCLNIASTTKIMTAHLVCKLAADKPEVLDEVLAFSQRADHTDGSAAGLRAGEQIAVRELLYGLLLPSGNDAAVALAEHFGHRLTGTLPPADPLSEFVAAMNKRTTELGLGHTQFANPHGLTAETHLSSAADLVRLAVAARQSPLFREYVATRQHGCTVTSQAGYSRNILWKNTNQLLDLEDYSGIKTGTTKAAGACLVSCGKRGEHELIVVVLGSTSSDARYTDSRNLFRWAWDQCEQSATSR